MAARYAWATLALLAVQVLTPSPAKGQWTTTDWKVYCYTPPLEQWLGPNGSGDAAAHDAYQAIVSSYALQPSCSDSDPYTLAGKVRESLRRISQWLMHQGFPAPNVPFVNGRFEAVVVPPEAGRVCYLGQCADDRPFYAYVGSTTPEQNRTNPNLLVLRTEQLGHAHELFHAVQHAFDSFQVGSVPNWVKEGTAQAVGLTWSKVSAHTRLSTRNFSESLHRSAEPLEAYNDEAFWRGLARTRASDGAHLFYAERYGHLVWLFNQDLASGSLTALDAMLQRELNLQDGLADAYPEVLATELRESRFHNDLPEVDLAFPDTVQRLQDRAADIGANAYVVRLEVPEDDAGFLTIRVPPELDEEYLHLIVEDQVRDEPGSTERRNEYTTVLPAGQHEFLVRLANVPTDVSTVDDYSAAYAGTPFASGSSAAPIEFTLERVDNAYEFVVEGDVASALAGRLAINGNLMAGGRCLVQLWFHSATGAPIVHSSLRIEAVLSEGFRTGEFSFGHKTSIRHGVQDMMATPDVFFAELGAEDTPFRSLAGTISITRQGTSLVTGTFALEAEEVEPWDLSYQRHASVRGNFVAPLLEDGDMFGQHYRCPTPE